MGSLRIRKVIYSGQKYHFESKVFDKNIVVIEGDNGTGKSTLCDLIYFALGGRVKQFKKDSDKRHEEITSDSNNYVELYIYINKKPYMLRRFLSENDITITPFKEQKITEEDKENTIFDVSSYADKTKILAIHRSDDVPYIFSDWVLEQLDISVVELYQGYKNFKINFTDLMRLIYHDQEPDPEGIYKKLDGKSNFISDSETLRKAVFELLVGKSYSSFYEAISKEKQAEKESLIAKSFVDEYKLIANKMRGNTEFKNKKFLEEELAKKDNQLERLNMSREAFKRNRENTDGLDDDIDRLKNSIVSLELNISELKESLVHLYDERYKLTSIKKGTIKEVEQIQKVIHAHDHLNLFASDSCPYCLTKVERVLGQCVCGSSIEEEQYERFFYTSQEYNDILKAKTKSLSTIEIALEDCNEDISNISEKLESFEDDLFNKKDKFKKLLDRLDQKFDLDSINDIDDKILETREEASQLAKAIEIEEKLENLQIVYQEKKDLASKLELERKELEIKAQKDIAEKVMTVSSIYNEYMQETLQDCRSARIKSSDYMPLIDEGLYKEASSRVSIRLMYYLSLMKLSLTERDVSFPRFLLIDTPETAGIELNKLINCIEKFEDLEELSDDFQIILATGLNKYPASLKDNRVLFMPTKSDALLKPRD